MADIPFQCEVSFAGTVSDLDKLYELEARIHKFIEEAVVDVTGFKPIDAFRVQTDVEMGRPWYALGKGRTR